jgi:hypothetical protein
MKIAAGIIEYGDAEGLDRCLSTLGLGKGGFDGAIVVHRKFDHFELEDTYNNFLSETLRVAKKYPNVYVDHDSEHRPTQIEARNMYMQLAGRLGYGWLMVIDSDEYVLPNVDWPKFHSQLEFVDSLQLDHQIFDVQFEGSMSNRGMRPRLFKDPSTIQYWTKHWWWVKTKSNELLRGLSDAGRAISGIYLYHAKSIRTPEHVYASMNYYDWQDIIEQPKGLTLVDSGLKEAIESTPTDS